MTLGLQGADTDANQAPAQAVGMRHDPMRGDDLSLDGFGEWLRLGALRRKPTKIGTVIRYRKV